MQSSPWLFYLVFTGQILLISYYFPKRLSDRMSRLLRDYPPAEYPKLYPDSAGYYRTANSNFTWANRLILLLGFGILIAVTRLDPQEDGGFSEVWPVAYGMIQALPLIGIEIVSFRQFQRMREAGGASVRKASLRPRRFFDLVSPWLLGTAVVMWLAMIIIDSILHGHLRWEHAFWMTFANVFMIATASWQWFGRKPDPHQDSEDRNRHLAAQWSSVFSVSIAISMFSLVWSADSVFSMDALDAPIMSLYFQVIAFLTIGHLMRAMRLEDINFEVYRHVEPPNAPVS